jgi:uncharacterized membrane protein (UPF0127 family)
MRFFPLLLLLALLAAGCGSSSESSYELGIRSVKLPNGQIIRAEVEVTPIDMQKGMMFRDSLPRGRGMLFVHDKPGMYPYWMFQVKIPLDMLWMDASRNVVEISADTPPCKSKASECPNYGGHQDAQYVLELGGGEARRLGLRVGDTLEF